MSDDIWQLTERGETVTSALEALRAVGIEVRGVSLSDQVAIPSAAEEIAGIHEMLDAQEAQHRQEIAQQWRQMAAQQIALPEPLSPLERVLEAIASVSFELARLPSELDVIAEAIASADLARRLTDAQRSLGRAEHAIQRMRGVR